MIEFIAQRWAPRLLSVLRIVTAFLFMAHGAQKLLGFPAPMTSPPALFSLIGLAGALELVGGGLLLERSDRKSTRLNSSHGYISYAVFCLKKKKRNHYRSATATRRYPSPPSSQTTPQR